MESLEFSWLHDESNLKDALKSTLGSSGQLIKKYFSSKELARSVKRKEVARLPLTFVNHGKINPSYVGPEITILTETNEILVLHKPPGIHCHPLAYDDKNTLLNFLVSKNKWEAIHVNQDHYDRGLMYRLDFETSGVIVLAKSDKYLRFMRENFDSAMKKKFYWAIVEGDFNREGRWVHYFKSTGHKGVKQKVSEYQMEDSFEGIFSVLKVRTNLGKSLLLVNLKTGLRHQIRAQLSHLGFPILGDELYGGKKAERIFLHAFRYEFSEIVEDPDAELFNIFFDLNGTLQMSHDMLGRF